MPANLSSNRLDSSIERYAGTDRERGVGDSRQERRSGTFIKWSHVVPPGPKENHSSPWYDLPNRFRIIRLLNLSIRGPPAESADGLLDRADTLAWDNFWVPAAPLYAEAQRRFVADDRPDKTL